MDNATVYLWWPLAVSAGLALLTLTFEPATARAATLLRALAVAAFIVACVLVAVGIA